MDLVAQMLKRRSEANADEQKQMDSLDSLLLSKEEKVADQKRRADYAAAHNALPEVKKRRVEHDALPELKKRKAEHDAERRAIARIERDLGLIYLGLDPSAIYLVVRAEDVSDEEAQREGGGSADSHLAHFFKGERGEALAMWCEERLQELAADDDWAAQRRMCIHSINGAGWARVGPGGFGCLLINPIFNTTPKYLAVLFAMGSRSTSGWEAGMYEGEVDDEGKAQLKWLKKS